MPVDERVYGPWAYRAWGYGLPCLVRGCETRDRRPDAVKVIECVHVTTAGFGRKSEWRDTVFMCWRHHDELHIGGIRTFERGHQLRVDAGLLGQYDVGTLAEAAQVTQYFYGIREEGLSE